MTRNSRMTGLLVRLGFVLAVFLLILVGYAATTRADQPTPGAPPVTPGAPTPPPTPAPDPGKPIVVEPCCRDYASVLKFNAVTITPEPLVGKVVTLRLELVASRDVPDATILITLPEEIALVTGAATWQVPLVAGQPTVQEVTLRVLKPSHTLLFVQVYSPAGPATETFALESLSIDSQIDRATVLPSSYEGRKVLVVHDPAARNQTGPDPEAPIR